MKTAIYYLLMVGLPFLGLLGILKAGNRIVPPRSIGGVWDVELPGPNEAATDCPGFAFGAGPREMHVSQSGVWANLLVNDRAATSFTIELHGDTVLGTFPGGGRPGCPEVTTLHALVLTEAGRDAMVGELRDADCADCPTVALRATHRARATRP